MSFSINPVEGDQCVFLSCEGEMPLVEFSAARYRAHGILALRRRTRMVVDMTQLPSIPTPAELFHDAKARDWVKQASPSRKAIRRNGKFSSDRTIAEYANEIWKVQPCPVS